MEFGTSGKLYASGNRDVRFLVAYEELRLRQADLVSCTYYQGPSSCEVSIISSGIDGDNHVNVPCFHKQRLERNTLAVFTTVHEAKEGLVHIEESRRINSLERIGKQGDIDFQ